MNIIILTSMENRHDYVSSKIINYFNNDNIFLLKEPKASKDRNKSKFNKFINSKNKFIKLKKFIINFIFFKFLKKVAKEKKETELKYFGDLDKATLAILKSKTLSEVSMGESINDIKYVTKIINFQPDIIIVMGTSLIKDEIIKIPKLGILNIHTGLSPYYRGGMTNFWPFIYNDLGCCGVTVHKLDIGIDSGDIIYHGLPIINEHDTYSSINCKAIKLGTQLMIKAVEQLQNDNLNSIKQWKENNYKLFFNRDYNGYYAYKYVNTYKKTISKFLKNKQYPNKLILEEFNES